MAVSRRNFIKMTASGIAAIYGAGPIALAAPPKPGASVAPILTAKDFSDLLTTWCDGLLATQINGIGYASLNGGLLCPACGMVHGRCFDALYPLMHVASATGQSRYLDAAVRLQAWADVVTRPDGSWVNDLSLGDWKGITVFGAIALAEALRHHGHLLDDAVHRRWIDRLSRAAKFLDTFINIHTGNINYPITSSLAFTVCGLVLDDKHYLDRGRKMAHASLDYFSQNHLLFGEGHPQAGKSAKGFLPIDIGYNVEESVPALGLYALLAKDQEMLAKTVAVMQGHMELMLPDGGWDNSFGTRNYKWTWWGSRTSDGCHSGYALLADHDARFAEVSRRNLAMMASCTHDGLLYGGPDLFLNGDRPCVHHTFTHAKSLATVIDWGGPKPVAGPLKLPRDQPYGIKHLEEVGTWLISIGPWRGTVTEYDWDYAPASHATGGALTLLYHMQLGPILASSMTEYSMVEASNQQSHGDYPVMPLTPRIEMSIGGTPYTSLSDKSAVVTTQEADGGKTFYARGKLLNARSVPPPAGEAAYRIRYLFTEKFVEIRAAADQAAGAKLIVPILSPQTEAIQRVDANTVHIQKPAGTLVIATTSSAGLKMNSEQRFFNLVPGLQCLPLEVRIDAGIETAIQISLP